MLIALIPLALSVFLLPSIATPPCQCPLSNGGETGTLINTVTEYRCSYPNGACAWGVLSGDLVQPAQSFCVDHQPCSSVPCSCADDVNGHYGYVIDYPVEFQCAYSGGACTWQSTSENATLQNGNQANCPPQAPLCFCSSGLC